MAWAGNMRFLCVLALISGSCALTTSDKSACQIDADCLEGRVCSNGLCGSLGDESQGPTSCPAVPCVAPATCELGLCATTVNVQPACDPYEFDDGCPSDAICDDSLESPRCLRFPPCGEGGTCPVGDYGSACSGGEIAGKEPMCLPGSCRSTGHCPQDWECVFPWGALGACSNGANGSPCASHNDCDSGNCNNFFYVCFQQGQSL